MNACFWNHDTIPVKQNAMPISQDTTIVEEKASLTEQNTGLYKAEYSDCETQYRFCGAEYMPCGAEDFHVRSIQLCGIQYSRYGREIISCEPECSPRGVQYSF